MHLLCFELENSDIRVAVGDNSVTECRQTKWQLYICMQKHYKHNKDGCRVPGVCGHGSLVGNVIMRNG